MISAARPDAPAGERLSVLALEPFGGGSHLAFLDGWRRHGRHAWTLETLPASHWKWRMRGAAPTLADRVRRRLAAGEGPWDVVVCSDMLDLAAFRGLAPPAVARRPAVVYFHENQLTYPVREERERDLHFAWTHVTTSLAATEAWFNSAFHRGEWLGALPRLLTRLPDHRPRRLVQRLAARSRVEPPGIDWPPAAPPARAPGPLHLLWVGRWEHDKAPERFFAALERAEDAGVGFRLSVLGERYREAPAAFARARHRFAGRIERWGWVEGRREYRRVLAGADAVVSTADHEFFGLAVLEAVAAGCFPVVPDRLAYPEVLAGEPDGSDAGGYLYDASGADRGEAALAARIGELAERLERGGGTRVALWRGDPECGRRAVERHAWHHRAPALDAALARVARGRKDRPG